MNTNPCHADISSFDLSKALTFSRFFSKVKLSPTARLVIRCLADFYNPRKGLMFPGQKTIADCTGAAEKSITNAIDELRSAGFIFTSKKGNCLNYYFTKRFFELLEEKPVNRSKEEVITEKHEFADSMRKNCGMDTVKIAGTCKQIHGNKLNKKVNNKVLNFQKVESEQRFPGVEETKKYLKEQRSIKAGSPLDFSKEEAINWLKSLPDFAKNGFFARELRKKWSIE